MRLHHITLALLFATLLASCTGRPKPIALTPAPESTIGVIILMDQKPKHFHVGTTVFSNFEKVSFSDWRISSALLGQLEQQISKRSGFKVKKLTPTTELSKKPATSAWDGYPIKIDGKRASELTSIAKRADVDVVLVFRNTDFPLWINAPVRTEGYGMFTRCQYSNCWAEALDHVSIYLYDTRTPRLVGWSDPKKGAGVSAGDVLLGWNVIRGGVKIAGVNLPKKLETLPRVEFDKARSAVLKILSDRAETLMQKSGL